MDRTNNSVPPSHPSSSNTPHDEVDLGIIFQKISNGFRSLGRKLKYVGQVIFRHFLIVGLFVCLGLGFSYLKFVRTPPEYMSSMTMTSFDIRNDYIEKLIVDLNQAVADRNPDLLSNMLNLSPDIVSQITQVKYTSLDERPFMEDSILVGQPFVVTVRTLDKTTFPALETGITHFLENNKYFANLKSIRKQRFENLDLRIDQELRQMDSLKAKLNASGSLQDPTKGAIIVGQAADPVNLFKESNALFHQQLAAKAVLSMPNNVNVISGLPPRLKPASPLLEEYLLFGLLGGFFVGTLLALFYERSRKPKHRPSYTKAKVVA